MLFLQSLFTRVFVFEAVFEGLLLDYEEYRQESCCPPEYDVCTNEAYRRQMLIFAHSVSWREFRPFSVAEDTRKERMSENDEANSSDEAQQRKGKHGDDAHTSE